MVRTWLYSILGLAGFLIISYLLITYGLPLVVPFVIAFILTEFMEPVVGLITWRNKIPRSVAVILTLILFVGLITMLLTAAIARLIQEILILRDNLPYLFAMAMDLAERFSEQFGAFQHTLPASVQQMLADNIQSFQKSLGEVLKDLSGTLGVITSLPGLVTNLLIALISTFYMSRDRREFGDFLLSLFPEVWRSKLRRVKVEVWSSAIGYAKAQATLVMLTMLQTIIGLVIIGADYSVLVGILVGISDVLPVIGPAAIFLPWVGYLIIAGNWALAIKLLILYATISAVRQVLEAKVVGDRLGLHPLAILFSMYLGFEFFGAIGFVFGPLLAILLKAMIKSGLLPIFQDTK